MKSEYIVNKKTQVPVISFVGWSGSGKTTIIEKLSPIDSEGNILSATVSRLSEKQAKRKEWLNHVHLSDSIPDSFKQVRSSYDKILS